MLFSFWSHVLRDADDESFLKLFEDSSLDFAHALLGSRQSQEVHGLESSCVGWLLHSFV